MDRGAWWAVVRRDRKELDRVEHGCTMYMKQIANKDLLYITWSPPQLCNNLYGERTLKKE